MPRTWILVAESSRAKLYSAKTRLAPLDEIEDFVHPQGRLHEGDLVSDRSGSDGGSVGQGRHVLDDKVSAKTHEAIGFAKTLAQHLETARNENAFNDLVLVAPPSFLGLLRDSMGKETMALVSRQVGKNLVRKPADFVRGYL